MQRIKHTRILILMIISQLLLTLFVIHWLYSQYRSTKEILVKELTGFWLDSHDQVLDSLVFRNYVDPVLAGRRLKVTGNNVKVAGVFASDSAIYIAPEDSKSVKEIQGKNIITVRINHDSDTSAKKAGVATNSGLEEDFLIRSVKMIVSHAEDTLKGNKKIMANFTMEADTAMFKKHFSKKLSDAGIKVNIKWEKRDDSTQKGDHRSFMIINPATQIPFPDAEIAKYRTYLAGRIMPQILFGLALIIITAMAFTLSYRSIKQQALLNDLREEFISNITHELKTPVSTLSIALESLQKYNMQAEPLVLDEYLKLASQETKRLSELINRVLDHSMLEANSSLLNIKVLNINQLVWDASDIMRHRISSGGSLTINTNPEVINAPVDPLFIKGVIINLIDNSLRYCDKTPQITVSTKLEKDFAIIEVVDNGPGIPVEYQTKIFEKFFRLPNDNIHNVKGYGLGLSFAALVIKLHRGTITVRNLDQGCMFTVKLPLL